MAFEVAWMQNTEYDAGEDRVLLDVVASEPGVRRPTHFKVTPTGSGLGVNVAAGHAIVRGTTIANQGLYAVRSTATETLAASAAPGGGQSRIDIVILEVLDGQVTGAGTGASDNRARIRIVQGVASSSPSAPAIPNSSLPLAQLNITTGLSTLTTGNIVNLRTLGGPGPHVGDMKMWPSSRMLPAGWIPRDGRAISRTVYADLWELIGDSYGTGDGSTTFNVPDDRGRVAAGMDSIPTIAGGTGASAGVVLATEADTLGGAHGQENVVLAPSEIPIHAHTINHNHPAHTTSGESNGHWHSGTTGLNNVNHIHTAPAAATYDGTGSAIALTNTVHTNIPVSIQSSGHQHAFTTGDRSAGHTHTFDVPNYTGNSGFVGEGQGHMNIQPTRFYIPLIKV